MTYDSLANQGDYLSPHYLAEVLPRHLKAGLLARWKEQYAGGRGRDTPQQGMRSLGKAFFSDRATLEADAEEFNRRPHTGRSGGWENGTRRRAAWRKTLGELHGTILRALAYEPTETTVTVTRAGREHQIPVFHAEPAGSPHAVAVECGWATNTDAALDPDGAGRLLDPIVIDPRETITTGSALATFLFSCQDPPRYVLLLAGGVVTLADRHAWGEGRYLSVSLDTALARRDTSLAGEMDLIAALFSADALNPPAEGGTEPLAELVTNSHQHAVGVSSDLRDGLRESVELIAQGVLARIHAAGVHHDQITLEPRNGEPADLARALTRESLRYLYRILFLLYAEARPDLGILPSDHPEYGDGYGLGRLGELVLRDLTSEEARNGYHLYESLDLLFRMVNRGHRPRGAATVTAATAAVTADRAPRELADPDAEAEAAAARKTSEGEGLRFEPLRSDLFEPGRIRLIGRDTLENPLYDEDDPATADQPRHLDTRLRNDTLHKVLRRLMLTRAKSGRKGSRGGFISYAQLGINQLGAVYEGLMSYTGFIADEELYEVAKDGDPTGGSWMIPASRITEYQDEVFVYRTDEETGKRHRVRHPVGSFIYRLAGRDRQTSASYYTPESLTRVTVQLALQHRMEEETPTPTAADLLTWRICEPALGSGAFLNEAINQVAAKYLELREQELDEPIPTERRENELRKVKAYLALHNCYGVDLNATAVELAEVSLWLNVMHPGLQAPWFGLHLRRGNSLIGAGRRVYDEEIVRKGEWRDAAPTDCPMTTGDLPEGTIHHFLLPAAGWSAVAGEKEAKELAPEAAKQLATWRRAMRKAPSTKKPRGKKQSQVQRLQALAGRAEYLWGLVTKRLEISEREISRSIDVWGAEGLPQPTEAVPREKVQADLRSPGTPFWRLKTVMDAWCALWFWPVDGAGLLDGTAEIYQRLDELTESGPRSGRRAVIPLADLDDWIDFAEAALGSADLGEMTLASDFVRLSELEAHEEQLPGWMGMDSPLRLEDRFPWVVAAGEIAEKQGFFHWELEFAQVFGRGGFDLQMGNPPWVRPRWDEASVLAEFEPWFKLTEKPRVDEWRQRKSRSLAAKQVLGSVLNELAVHTGTEDFFGSSSTYPLLVGTQADLYRPFMIRVWANLNSHGTAGLLHPKSHLDGAREGKLRAAAYRRLRFHAHFQNRRLIFSEIDWDIQYSVHIYGADQAISFTHVSWLFDTATLMGSVTDDGTGELPGIKHQGTWDLRPHRDRLITVDKNVLDQWRLLTGERDTPVEETKLLYPVTSAEQGAITALARVERRLGEADPQITRGYDEKGAKDSGLIRWETHYPAEWSEVVLRGPQFAVATPFAKQPPNTKHTDKPVDLTELPANAVPSADYRRATDVVRFRRAQDTWHGRRYTDFYRVAWRRRMSASNERCLFASIIPPGATHVHSVYSMALTDNRVTAMVAGFWAAIPLDYLLRVTGKVDLQWRDARSMPFPEMDHQLSSSLLLRTLRLNCLTNAYAELWEELYDNSWRDEEWKVHWPGLPSLGQTESVWNFTTPLRTERERRAALVEIDALVSCWLNIEAEELIAIYMSRFPQLVDYENEMWFDASGRKLAANFNAWGHGQTKEHYTQLLAHLADPAATPPPEGYTPPFYKADREKEMRQAHAVFTSRLNAATTPSGGSQ